MAVPVLSSLRVTDRPRWRLRSRRDINFILNFTLPWLLILSFATGWIASWLGLTEFGLHKYSSIGVFVVALAHLALHWRSLVVHLRRFAGGPAPARPTLRLVDPQGDNLVTGMAAGDLVATGT